MRRVYEHGNGEKAGMKEPVIPKQVAVRFV